SLKTSIKTITYLSDIGCLEIQGASLASANNAGFLAAVLRSPDICLLEAHPEKLFTHVLYPDWRERLNKLNTISSQEKITED
ncbi:hypothetical protein MZE89_22905, partial [Escherichia coli]|nr:hypothetical protein [Escherichia coli]MCK2721862.1 hypothetical protein [Escherichia coli]MCK2735671.1 hypothetical protein [Escherichia coli]MCK2740060.1 hypothetical protein [Escherichia coli]MCK2753387.1 hypothetical protein [Escherichia coli]